MGVMAAGAEPVSDIRSARRSAWSPAAAGAARGHTLDGSVQIAAGVVLITLTAITARPLGLTGEPGVVTLLLVLNAGFLAFRLVPAGRIAPRYELAVLLCWAVASSALLGLRVDSVAPSFAYYTAGHAGYRLSLWRAVAVSGLVSGLSMLSLATLGHHGGSSWAWLLGATVFLPVFLGMANRSRDQAAAAAMQAAESARRAAQAETRAAALTERARISRDVHDVLAHSLSGVSMQLELGELLLDSGRTAEARAALGRAHSLVREGMAEANRAVAALREDALPLPESLAALFAGSARLTVTGPDRPLPTEVTHALLRMAQESLTNARRHAPGSQIGADLVIGTRAVTLAVSNGPATDSGSVSPGSGMGLIGMRERVALQGGTVAAGPLVDGPWAGGWQVVMSVPVGPPGGPQ